MPDLLANASYIGKIEAENKITELIELHLQGIITDAEYVSKKGPLLDIIKR